MFIFKLKLPPEFFISRSHARCMTGCVVVADSIENARKIASFFAGEEGQEAWTKTAQVRQIGWAPISASAEVISGEFVHG